MITSCFFLFASFFSWSINDFQVSGPPNMTKEFTDEVDGKAKVTLSWTPLEKDLHRFVPVCFTAETSETWVVSCFNVQLVICAILAELRAKTDKQLWYYWYYCCYLLFFFLHSALKPIFYVLSFSQSDMRCVVIMVIRSSLVQGQLIICFLVLYFYFPSLSSGPPWDRKNCMVVNVKRQFFYPV